MELAILTDEISLDLDEALVEAKKLGLRRFEIRCIDSYENRIPNFRPGRLDRLQEAVSKESIDITAVTPGTFKIDFSDTDRLRKELDEVLPKTCEMAVQLGAPRVIVFGFMRGNGGTEKESVAHLREAGSVAASFGLQLSVENEPGSFCDTGVHTAEIVGSVDMRNVGINWDPANAVTAGEAAYPVGYEAVRPFLQNVHIKDSIPIPPDKWENRLIGDGAVNWLGQLWALRRDALLSHLTLETHVFPVLEATREDLRRLRILFETLDKLDAEQR